MKGRSALRAEQWDAGMRVGDVLLRAAHQHPDRDAVVLADQRRSFVELRDRSFAIGRALLSRGIGPGSHVGLLMPNCHEFIDFMFGTMLVGAVVVPINSRFAPRELGYVIENADLELLVTSDVNVEHVDYVSILQEALPGLAARPPGASPRLEAAPALRDILLIGEREAPEMIGRQAFELEAERFGDQDVSAMHQRSMVRSVAMIMYTSGTTAMPKGCLIPHEALVRPAFGFGREKFRLEEGDRFWDPLPMFHMSAIVPLLATFDAGAAFLSMTHMEPGAALRMIEEEEATAIYPSFPAVTQALLNHPDYTADSFKRVRLAMNVAPEDMLRDMQARMPHTVQLSCFGLTEGGGPICITDPDEPLDARCTTSGTPLAGMEIEVRDLETGLPAAVDAPGEILVRGFGVFDGYHKDPQRSAATVEADGWCHTGDIGSLDAAGLLRYRGRTKEMIKVGGENVGAIEIESHLATHPAVAMVAIVAVPDPKYVEVPAAFVELRPGFEASEEEILEHCRGGLARFKVPRHVRFVTEWPTSATKVQKFRLQEELAEELAAARIAVGS